jgi:hypothetical protein
VLEDVSIACIRIDPHNP